jgi:DNA-binding GntR family transcriptional regulator
LRRFRSWGRAGNRADDRFPGAREGQDAGRREILRGALPLGERLSPSAMAQEYGVSLSVVREALTRLAEPRVLAAAARVHGHHDLAGDLLDPTSVRIDIETLALRRSVANGDVEWRTALVAAHYRIEQTPGY